MCALITEKYVLFSNCGDSRGVLSMKGDGGGSNPALATQDHKPSNTIERERIQNAGGNVMIQRVNGSLALAPALAVAPPALALRTYSPAGATARAPLRRRARWCP